MPAECQNCLDGTPAETACEICDAGLCAECASEGGHICQDCIDEGYSNRDAEPPDYDEPEMPDTDND